MPAVIESLTLDCNDLDGEADFWAAALRYAVVERHDDYAALETPECPPSADRAPRTSATSLDDVVPGAVDKAKLKSKDAGEITVTFLAPTSGAAPDEYRMRCEGASSGSSTPRWCRATPIRASNADGTPASSSRLRPALRVRRWPTASRFGDDGVSARPTGTGRW